MALTLDFKVTVRERLQRDLSFREALLEEAVDTPSGSLGGGSMAAQPI